MDKQKIIENLENFKYYVGLYNQKVGNKVLWFDSNLKEALDFSSYKDRGHIFSCLRYLENIVLDLKDFKISLIEEYGGYEGSGEETFLVFKFEDLKTNECKFVKFNGSYSSYDDTDWHEKFDFVVPREVKVTKWLSE